MSLRLDDNEMKAIAKTQQVIDDFINGMQQATILSRATSIELYVETLPKLLNDTLIRLDPNNYAGRV